ncbi:NAD(P)H-dependent oxidoreductase, partial [Pseudomonas otitidis]
MRLVAGHVAVDVGALHHIHREEGRQRLHAEELQKFLWADVIVWQMPGWWMGAPWTVKRYIDEVFT